MSRLILKCVTYIGNDNICKKDLFRCSYCTRRTFGEDVLTINHYVCENKLNKQTYSTTKHQNIMVKHGTSLPNQKS